MFLILIFYRMKDYMDAYESQGFLSTGAQAHYVGGTGMIYISNSTNPSVISNYHRYCQIITDRQTIVDQKSTSMWMLY